MTEFGQALKLFVRRRATEMLELPTGERNAAYQRVWEAAQAVAVSRGLPEARADAWAQRIVGFTRAMVSELEMERSLSVLAELALEPESPALEVARAA